MKRIILPLCLLLLCGCQKEELNTNFKKDTVSKTPQEEVVKYVDENPVKISLYGDGPVGDFVRIYDKFESNWIKKKDIVVFDSIFSDDESINGYYFQDVWHEYASKYEDYAKYKTGWNVSFELKDGTVFNKRIVNPSDVQEFYDYLEIYLYDSANVPKHTFYSHLLDEQMTDSTVMTTIKLTAGSKYEEINGPIHLMVFTFDTEDDFDSTGNYIGNSYYKLDIINTNNQ